jgi:hypothetical protein
MNVDQIRAASAILLAAAEGQIVQFRVCPTCPWENIQAEDASWDFSRFEYRIQPEPVSVSVRLYRRQGGTIIPTVVNGLHIPSTWTPCSDEVQIEVKA